MKTSSNRQVSLQRHLLASIAQRFAHPDKLFQELVYPSNVGLVEQRSIRIENIPHAGKVYVPEDCDQAQLAHHWQKIFDDVSAAKLPRRDTYYNNCFVNLFIQ